MPEDFELPEWMLDKIRAEYAKEIANMIADGDDASISPGWYGSDLNLTVIANDKDVLVNKFSLEDLCNEPATGWHNRGEADQYHYDMIKEIADKLKAQADRLYAVHAKLSVRKD